MAESKRLVRPLISVLLIGATALGLYNVYGDNAEVVAMAKQVACSEQPKCTADLQSAERHAFGQAFTFRTNLKGESTVGVTCKRSLYLVGPYACQKK